MEMMKGDSESAQPVIPDDQYESEATPAPSEGYEVEGYGESPQVEIIEDTNDEKISIFGSRFDGKSILRWFVIALLFWATYVAITGFFSCMRGAPKSEGDKAQTEASSEADSEIEESDDEGELVEEGNPEEDDLVEVDSSSSRETKKSKSRKSDELIEGKLDPVESLGSVRKMLDRGYRPPRKGSRKFGKRGIARRGPRKASTGTGESRALEDGIDRF